jgi:hypothetical protein
MKNTLNQFVLSFSRINKTHLQFALMLIALVMLVLGAGAPEDVGGSGR